jgi:hypothetical protein
MGVFNILLAYSILFGRQTLVHTTELSNSRKKSLSMTVLMITTFFIILTFPDNIINAFFLPILLNQGYGYTLIFFIDSFIFSYHAFHFAILLISNKRFYEEFNLVFKIKRSNRVGIQATANSLPTNHRTIIKPDDKKGIRRHK